MKSLEAVMLMLLVGGSCRRTVSSVVVIDGDRKLLVTYRNRKSDSVVVVTMPRLDSRVPVVLTGAAVLAGPCGPLGSLGLNTSWVYWPNRKLTLDEFPAMTWRSTCLAW